MFFILRKREIENYLHPNVIIRSHRTPIPDDDFSDMKKIFGLHVYKVVADMTVSEILEADRYEEGKTEHHELEEIILALLSLAESK